MTDYTRKEREAWSALLGGYVPKNATLKKRNLSLSRYKRLWDLQQGRCAICREPFDAECRVTTPCIDHCHVTNRARGLLCSPCNSVLGYAYDRSRVLRAAADYVEKYADQFCMGNTSHNALERKLELAQDRLLLSTPSVSSAKVG